MGGLAAAAWLAGAAIASAAATPAPAGSSSPLVVAEQGERPAWATAGAGALGREPLTTGQPAKPAALVAQAPTAKPRPTRPVVSAPTVPLSLSQPTPSQPTAA